MVKFREDKIYVLLESVYSFDVGDRFTMKDGQLVGPDGLTLDPKLFKGKNGRFYITEVMS